MEELRRVGNTGQERQVRLIQCVWAIPAKYLDSPVTGNARAGGTNDVSKHRSEVKHTCDTEIGLGA